MTTRLRVLFVTPYLPSPPRFGGQRRLHGILSGVAASSDVSVLSLVDPREDQAEARRATEAYCRRVTTVAGPRFTGSLAGKRLVQLGSLLSPWSYERLVHLRRALAAALGHLLATERFDVVQFEFSHMAAYRPGVRAAPADGPAFFLDEHNIEFDVVRQTAEAGVGALRRAFSAIDWRKVRAEELGAWSRVDGCTLTSARDRDRLLRLAPGTRTRVVPNGVDLGTFLPGAGREPRRVLFFGAVDYYPNTEGLLFFLDSVLPILRRRVPGVRLSIVGRRPPAAILARRGADVEITGEVDDLRPHIARAAAVIAPLRIGGGTRLKILEAMAMGKAVVSTSLGAEGIDVVAGRDLLIADDAEAFADRLAQVLEDDALADRLGASARRLVEARHGWAASVEELCRFYHEVLEARRAA
jgi:glycosyltransferase involved in cell wall biosynthesis